MKFTILLTGKNGQVGRELAALLPRLGDIVALNRQELDISKPEEIRRVVRAVRPTLIVNAAAYTAVDKAESEEAAARAVNAEAPAILAEEARKIGAALVHYSTDYVFDGSKRTPYVEDDPTNPMNAYGRTKLAGESAIRATGVPHLIFRTAWIYAPQGRNFLLTILRLASERRELRVVQDQIGAPTSSREVAAATVQILSQARAQLNGQASWDDLSGTYHMTAAGETSWCGFAEAILEEALHHTTESPWFVVATHRRPLIARRIIPIATTEYPTLVRRPAYAVLSNTRLARRFGIQLPDWRAQLHLLFSESLREKSADR